MNSQTPSEITILHNVQELDDLCDTHATVLLTVTFHILPAAQKFSPVYEEIASSLVASGSDIVCAQIDADGTRGLWDKFGYLRYPTVVLHHGPRNFKKYVGPLRKKEILAFVTRQQMPVVSFVDSAAALDSLRTAHEAVAVAYLDAEDHVSRASFTATADKLKDDVVFCVFEGPDWSEEGNSGIVVYKNVPDESSVLAVAEALSIEAITDFIKTAARPLILELLPELHGPLLEQPLPIGYLFVDSASRHQQLAIEFLPLARKYQSRVRFVIVHAADFPDLSEQMHVNLHELPAFVLRYPQRRYAYPLKPSTASDLQLDKVATFIESFLAGQVQPKIKSAPIPETQGPIIEIVGFTYDEIIMNPDKDVLVEYYTPWCGPCKAILPVYEKLALLYSSDEKARDLVTVAKMEYEGNDVPDTDIRGFPWFKLYPAANKGEPVTYSGDWTVKDWVRFIQEAGFHGVALKVDDE
ncbi:thioredoxin-like protein [Immersiella caudata]|uniref:Protein disulfide-isomerase n=1 Tax=Immersiella caudata TaxID=314043 RepID=A0AA40BXU4_9PEZI|nr:thioredoxin-like protein [Immersiella caudata]